MLMFKKLKAESVGPQMCCYNNAILSQLDHAHVLLQQCNAEPARPCTCSVATVQCWASWTRHILLQQCNAKPAGPCSCCCNNSMLNQLDRAHAAAIMQCWTSWTMHMFCCKKSNAKSVSPCTCSCNNSVLSQLDHTHAVAILQCTAGKN
jgi:hypothetical protein